MNNKKDAFLIIRISKVTKDKIRKKALKLGQTISDLVRPYLDKIK